MTSKNTLHPRQLDAALAGGVGWTVAAKWTTQIFSWTSVFVVARLLSQSDYGIGAIAGIFFGIANLLAEFGVGTAVLHMPELDRKALGQLHSFSMLLCSLIFGLSLFAVPGLAWFFRSNHVAFFVVVNCGFLITGFQAVPIGLLQRDMNYRRLALLDATNALTNAAVTVIVAWLGWGYWALAAGMISGNLAAAILLSFWKPVPFRWPRWGDLRGPVEMGRHVAIARIASASYSMADGVVIGRVFGEAVLGSYRMAMNLASAPADKITTLIMRAATPLFANVKDDPVLVRRYYLIIVEMLSLSVMPAMVGLAIVASDAVRLILGQKWVAATRPLQWLGLFMIMRVLGVVAEQVLVSQRLTRFTMRMSVFNFAVMPIAFWLAARWKGAEGVAAAWIALSPVTIAPLLIILLWKINLPLREYAIALLPALAGSAVMGVAVVAVKHWLPPLWTPQLRLITEVSVGGVAYAGLIVCFFRARILRYVNFLANMRKNRTSPAAP